MDTSTRDSVSTWAAGRNKQGEGTHASPTDGGQVAGVSYRRWAGGAACQVAGDVLEQLVGPFDLKAVLLGEERAAHLAVRKRAGEGRVGGSTMRASEAMLRRASASATGASAERTSDARFRSSSSSVYRSPHQVHARLRVAHKRTQAWHGQLPAGNTGAGANQGT